MSEVTDTSGGESDSLASSVEAARAGDRGALERVIRGVQDDVYRLALRMTACPEDGRDACQEILIKVVTRLDSFRGESSIRTWCTGSRYGTSSIGRRAGSSSWP